MSTKAFMAFAISNGHSHINLQAGHDRDLADAFLNTIGNARYKYQGESTEQLPLKENSLVIFANSSGVIIEGFDLAFELALGNKEAEKAAKSFKSLVATAYNDQCLIDVFSFFEGGKLIRRGSEMDGDDKALSEGALLPEEIQALKEDVLSKEEIEEEDTYEFEIEGEVYHAYSQLPMRGAGLELAKRFIGEDPIDLHLHQYSVYSKKPWWKRW